MFESLRKEPGRKERTISLCNLIFFFFFLKPSACHHTDCVVSVFFSPQKSFSLVLEALDYDNDTSSSVEGVFAHTCVPFYSCVVRNVNKRGAELNNNKQKESCEGVIIPLILTHVMF